LGKFSKKLSVPIAARGASSPVGRDETAPSESCRTTPRSDEGHLAQQRPASRLERDFWIAVMKAQRDLGVPIPADAIKDYERVKADIDLGSIAKPRARDAPRREGAARGILRARETAVHPSRAHEPRPHGNVEQLQILRALKLVHFKSAAALLALAAQAEQHRDLMITGRTHNVPAQPTTLASGSRCSDRNCLSHSRGSKNCSRVIPCADSRAPSARNSISSPSSVAAPTKSTSSSACVLKHLGFHTRSLDAVGAGLSRSLDFEVVSRAGKPARRGRGELRDDAAAMAGAGLLTEGFQDGQVGSSAMPHKVNARNCEACAALSTILSGTSR